MSTFLQVMSYKLNLQKKTSEIQDRSTHSNYPYKQKMILYWSLEMHCLVLGTLQKFQLKNCGVGKEYCNMTFIVVVVDNDDDTSDAVIIVLL